jgi:hypothetical protein
MSINELKSLVSDYLHMEYEQETNEEFLETLDYCNFKDYE